MRASAEVLSYRLGICSKTHLRNNYAVKSQHLIQSDRSDLVPCRIPLTKYGNIDPPFAVGIWHEADVRRMIRRKLLLESGICHDGAN